MFKFNCFTPDGESFSRLGGKSLYFKMITDLGAISARLKMAPGALIKLNEDFFFIIIYLF